MKIPSNNVQKVKTYCLNTFSQITAAWSKWGALFVVFVNILAYFNVLVLSHSILLAAFEHINWTCCHAIPIGSVLRHSNDGQVLWTLTEGVWAEPCRVDWKKENGESSVCMCTDLQPTHLFPPRQVFTHIHTQICLSVSQTLTGSE